MLWNENQTLFLCRVGKMEWVRAKKKTPLNVLFLSFIGFFFINKWEDVNKNPPQNVNKTAFVSSFTFYTCKWSKQLLYKQVCK